MIVNEKHKFYLNLIKIGAGVASGALVLTENHPYATLMLMVIAAVASEALNYKKS